MWARLKATIKHLRFRSKRRTIELRQLRDVVRSKDRTILALRARIQELESITEPQRVFNCVYPAQMMALAVYMVVNGASLRCAAASSGFFAELMGWDHPAPSWKTISHWVKRCGLYSLQLTQNLEGEYTAVIDASIQIGKEQLLLMLGVKNQPGRCRSAPLTMQDVVVLGMEVQNGWLGKEVADFIKRNLELRPLVKLTHVISDRGTNLLAAFRRLDLPWVSDCTHVMMNIVKQLFDHDVSLKEMSGKIGELRKNHAFTIWAGLLPPTLRNKDRFLKIFTIVDWVDRIDGYWNKLPARMRSQVKFCRNRWLILRLRQVHELIIISSRILKNAGLSEKSHQRWRVAVKEYRGRHRVMTWQAKFFIAEMETYFVQHANRYKGLDQVLCCSEIIESIFSRYKNKGGMKAISADVLSINLYSQVISTKFIHDAMAAVSCKAVDEWQQKNVCHNRYGLRRRMDKELRTVDG